ncbi:MAG: T9SS type A sorting domain-containing protein [Flavipsychrobacter sp.]
MRFKNLLFTIIAVFLFSSATNAQLSRVQFIHNSGDISILGVDIYIDGVLQVDDLFFRTSSFFNGVNATNPVRISVAPNTSFSEADSFYSTTMTLTPGGIYLMILAGNESTSGYSPNVPFHFDVNNMGREAASIFTNTDIMFYHGATDGSTMDIRAGVTTYADNISYGNFIGYAEFKTSDLIYRTTNTSGTVINTSYEAPLLTNHSMTGQAGVVLLSGYQNPSNNSNGPAMGLWLVNTNGGPFINLSETNHEKLARLQLIHNSGDTIASKVDVYIDGTKRFDDMDYKTATTYFDAYANQPTTFALAKSNSTSIADTFFSMTTSLDSTKTYAAVIHGIKSAANYKPKPPMTIHLHNGAREAATVGTNTDILFINGSTDLGAVDVLEGTNSLFSNVAYGNFSGYIQQATSNKVFTLNKNGGATISKHAANLQILNLQGQSITVLTTGFLEPDSNSGGPAVGMYAALSSGGALVELPVTNSIKNIKANNVKVDIVPNPTTNTIHISAPSILSNIIIYNVTGQTIMTIEKSSSNKIDVSHLAKGNYIITANGGTKTYYGRFTKL